jgi:copper chaperone NosL
VSLFLFTSNVQRFAPGRSIDQVARQYVTRVDGGTWLRAQDAFYVDGSSALGPMRAGNLPAFGSATAAERFADQRGGVVQTRAQIDQQVLDRLDTRGSHQHPERP